MGRNWKDGGQSRSWFCLHSGRISEGAGNRTSCKTIKRLDFMEHPKPGGSGKLQKIYLCQALMVFLLWNYRKKDCRTSSKNSTLDCLRSLIFSSLYVRTYCTTGTIVLPCIPSDSGNRQSQEFLLIQSHFFPAFSTLWDLFPNSFLPPRSFWSLFFAAFLLVIHLLWSRNSHALSLSQYCSSPQTRKATKQAAFFNGIDFPSTRKASELKKSYCKNGLNIWIAADLDAAK